MNTDIEILMNKYEYALEMLKVELGILIKEYTIKNKCNPVEHIKTRIKTMDSIIKKLEKKQCNLNIDNIKCNIHDVVGIRIVCSFLSDVYNIVNLIKKFKQIKVIGEKNYIISPKNSGYTSYHLIVAVPIYLDDTVEYIEAEIQVRTVAMDFWASLDHKIQYKFSKTIPEEVKQEMFNCAIDIKNLEHKMMQLNNIVNKYKN